MEAKNSIQDNSANFSNGLSYFHSVGTHPLVYRTIGQQLSLSALEDGDREAYVFVEENRRFTYGQLLREADRLAAGFQCLGLNRGDRVGLLAPNVSTWPLAMFAAARAGLILVSLNPAFDSQDIANSLNKVAAKVLVASEKFGSAYYYDKLLEIIPELKTSEPRSIQNKRLPHLSSIVIDAEQHYPGTLKLKNVMSLPTVSQINSIEEQQKDFNPDSGCNIQFTSGFTGSPKAVLISHFGEINGGYSFGKRGEIIKTSRICLPLPLCHIYATTVAMAALCYQATIVVPNYLYDTEKTLRTISQEKCTIIYGMPTMFMGLISKQKELKLDIKLQIGGSGGTQCSPELFKEIKKELGLIKLKVALGMTESGITFTSMSDGTDGQHNESIGYVFDHLEVKIIDDTGKILPFGTPGELCLRGHRIMMCYWGDEEKTRKVLGADGWLKTGDYFVLESNGYGRIIGRMSDIITKGTEKIFPKDIENVLAMCRSIAEVYVVGIPDEFCGEELCAFIRLRDGYKSFSHEDLHEFCKGKISSFKIPRYLEIVTDFPKTLSGKVKKTELKKQFLCNMQNN